MRGKFRRIFWTWLLTGLFLSGSLFSEQIKSYPFLITVRLYSKREEISKNDRVISCALFRPEALDLQTSNELALNDVEKTARDLEVRCENDTLVMPDILRTGYGFRHTVSDDALYPLIPAIPRWASEHIDFFLTFDDLFKIIHFYDDFKHLLSADYHPVADLALPSESMDIGEQKLHIFSTPDVGESQITAATLAVFQHAADPGLRLFFHFFRISIEENF